MPSPAAQDAAAVVAGTSNADDAYDEQSYIDGLIESLQAQPQRAQPLRLREAILIAIGNNPGLLADSRNRQIARQEIIAALGAYDPTVAVEGGYADSKVLTSDALLASGAPNGSGGALTLEQDEYVANFTLSKLLQTGAELDLSWRNNRTTTSAVRQLLSPRFDPTVGFTITQPILKDIGAIGARTDVSIATNTSRQAISDFETKLADFVTEVIEAYWSYTFAEADLRVRRMSWDLARELVEEAKARVDIGTLPPVAVKEAQADAAAREEEVLTAEHTLDLAGRTLQYTVMFGLKAGRAPLPVRPSEEHVVEQIPLDRAASLRTAVTRRSEVQSAKLTVRNARLEVKRADNQVLPSLDLVGSYELVGLGGRPTVDASTQQLSRASIDEIDAYNDALDNLTSTDYYSYRVGVQLDVPLSNATARAHQTQAEIAKRRSEDELRAVVSEIALEVEDSVGTVASAFKRVAAARIARELAEENLANQKKRYEVGMVTTTDILLFQDGLASAMAAEARAIADHAIAVARLQRAEGTLLESLGVDVHYEDAPETPWWARF